MNRSWSANLPTLVLKGLSWQYATVLSQGVAQLIVLAVLSRLLSPTDFGLIGSAMVFVGAASMFSQFGVAPAIVQRSDVSPRVLRVALSLSVLSGLLVTCLLWTCAGLTADFFGNERVADVVRAVSVTYILSAPGVVSEALLQRQLEFRKLMWANLGSYVVGYLVVGVCLAFLKYGVWSLVAAALSQALVKTVVLLAMQPVPIRPLYSIPEARDLLKYGGTFTLARVLNYGATEADVLIVGRMAGMAALGLYHRAYQLMMLPARYLGQTLERVMFPAMVKTQGRRTALARVYLTSTTAIALIVTPMSAVMCISAPEIVLVLLGEQWIGAVSPFQLLSIGVLFRTSYKLGDSLAKAQGALLQRSKREAMYLVSMVLGSLIGVRWGITGVAAGVLVAVAMNYFGAAQMSLGILGLRWKDYWECHIGGVVLATAAGAAAVIFRSIAQALGVSTFANLLLTTIGSVVASLCIAAYLPRMLGSRAVSTIDTVLQALPEPLMARTGLSGVARRYSDARLSVANM